MISYFAIFAFPVTDYSLPGPRPGQNCHPMTTQEKLASLRKLMKQYDLNAYIIPSTDPHQGEYIAEHWQTREWFSGFTGSTGNVVITHDFAGLWTDSRYFIQAQEELKGSGIELVKLQIPHTPEYIDWLVEKLPAGSKVGFDGKVVAAQLAMMMKKAFEPHQIQIDSGHDLPGMIWEDRPGLPQQPVFEHDKKMTGKSRWEKLALVREQMKAKNADFHLLTSLDDIAWLFNLRGSDVQYNPVFLSYAVITPSESLLFIDEKKIPDALQSRLQEEGLVVKPYDQATDYLRQLPQGSALWLTLSKVNQYLVDIVPGHCTLIDGLSAVAPMKAHKNTVEAANIRHAMVKDGVALVHFYRWLEDTLGKTTITEISLSEQLTKFRKQQDSFMGNSFSTIAGYQDHGAIVHYSASVATAYDIHPEGILLLDSGAQYLDGTTDITRTTALGKPTDEQRRDFTLVLKGHVELSRAVFPSGTKGFHLEVLARKALWQDGKNYGHGTGHGVGFFLNVHEGPQGISLNPAVNYPLEEGMVLSNEPGYYREGHYGMRTENLIMVVPFQESEYGPFLKFETLTLFPYDLALVDASLLNHDEKQWINHYHQVVYERLESYLDEEARSWLAHKTRAI